MGLSSEERVTKLYWGLHWLRQKVTALHECLPKADWRFDADRGRSITSELIGKIDLIVGNLIAGRDSNSAYWLLGPSKKGYRSHYEDKHNLPRPAVIFTQDMQTEHKHGSYRFFEEITFTEFVTYLAERSAVDAPDHKIKAKIIAAYWDMWEWINAILYPLHRYDDDCFKSTTVDSIHSLIGEIANRRYEIITGELGDCQLEARLETILLCKWRVWQLLLKKRSPAINQKNGEARKLKGSSYLTALHKKPYPGYELMREIGEMSTEKIHDILKADEDEQYQREREYEKKEGVKRDAPNLLFGTPVVEDSSDE